MGVAVASSHITATALTSRRILTGDASHAYQVFQEGCVADPLRPKTENQYGDPAIGFLLSGWCDYQCQSGKVTAVPGTVIFANHGEHYGVHHHNCPGIHRLVVYYSPQFVEAIAAAGGLDKARFPAVGLPPGKPAIRVFKQLRAMVAGSAAAEDAACALAHEALTADGKHVTEISGSDRRRIMSVVRYVQDFYTDTCSVDTLAAISGFSRYHFMRLFKAVTGQSPNQYVLNIRLRAAASRIIESKAQIADIALNVGFNDVSHFNFHFRGLFDCTPREMRKTLGISLEQDSAA